jgi:hypothetical protein
MNTVTHWLVLSALILISVSSAATFYKYAIKNDYSVVISIPCNPETHSCFIVEYECDEDTSGVCTDYYANVTVHRSYLSSCSPDDGECVISVCSTISSCEYEYCSHDNTDDTYVCSNTDESSI